VSSLSAQQANAQATHTLKPTPKTVAWGLTIAFQSVSHPQTDQQPIIYVKHLEPPLHYPQLARQVQFQGTVLIKLTMDSDGNVLTAKSLTHDEDPQANAHSLLTGETEKLIKKWTFGCTNCSPGAPYEKKIKFVYRLEGEPILYDDTRVSMDLPDEVIVTASPIQCDHCPPKKKGNN
jgi:hypothetical protein